MLPIFNLHSEEWLPRWTSLSLSEFNTLPGQQVYPGEENKVKEMLVLIQIQCLMISKMTSTTSSKQVCMPSTSATCHIMIFQSLTDYHIQQLRLYSLRLYSLYCLWQHRSLSLITLRCSTQGQNCLMIHFSKPSMWFCSIMGIIIPFYG